MENLLKKIEKFAELLEAEQISRFTKDYPKHPSILASCKVKIKEGKKYVKVDVGTSGKYMVDREGQIFGIKAYGVIHRGHFFGTLDTTGDYFWGGYRAVKKEKPLTDFEKFGNANKFFYGHKK